MSYLLQYARRPTSRRHGSARVDERLRLNFATFDGGAEVRVFVEDTSRWRAGDPPSPRVRLRVRDCANQIALDFGVESAELRANSLHKIDTLLGALTRFRDAFIAEATLYAERESRFAANRR